MAARTANHSLKPATSNTTMLSSPTAKAPGTMAPAKPASAKTTAKAAAYPSRAVGVWSTEEHDRFLDALKKYPQGPWKAITEFIGTRSVRQVQTHAQKYQEKVSRRLHGMQTGKAIRLRREHRIDHDVLALHTLISLPPELRNKHARRAAQQAAKQTPVVAATPSVAEAPAVVTPVKQEVQRPTLMTVDLNDKMLGLPSLGVDGSSPSSVSSSFLYDDSTFALMDVDDLPTLSESLDFFIENFS